MKALRAEITERKLTEETVKQAEDRIRLVIDTIPTMAWSLRPDGIVDFVNQRWLDYTGLSFEDAITEPNCIVHPEDLSWAVDKWRKDMAAGKSCEEEIRLRYADGKYRWFLVRTVPLRDEQGNIVKWYGISIDIEDRKRAEEALRESETRFRQVAENISEVFWLANPEGTLIHYVSPAYEKMWGRSCASLYAEPSSWMDSVHPDDRGRLAEAQRLQAIGGRRDHTYRIVRPDGSLRWIRGRGFPVRDEAGKLIRVAGIAEDITERKESEEGLRRSEEKFTTLFGIAPVGISLLDGQGNVVDANPALEQITRLSKEELLNGTYRRRTYRNADGTPKPASELPSERAIAENRSINNVEVGIVTENDEMIWAQVSVAPLELPDVSAVVIMQDITERKQAEQTLRESEERFRELAEHIDGVFWLSDPSYSAIFYVSPTYEKLWGRSCDSLYASPSSWIEAIHPEDKERIVQILADQELQRRLDMVYRIIHPDGSTRWMHARGFPVHDGSGAVVRIAGIAEDITERKRVELALDERLRFETLLTELSAAFANLPTTTVDEEIDKWLQNLVEFLDLDRATFDQIGEDGVTLSRSRSHTVSDIEPLSLVVTNDQLPWMTEQLLRGHTIKWSRIPDDMPEQASKEKEFADRIGAKSVLIIPVCIGGSLICAISFTSMRIYRDWPDETVARLRLVGEIFANAIARKRAAKELEEANHQLRLLSRRLFEVQEEERRHLARELHDEIGQSLTAAKINLQSVTGNVGSAHFARLQETTAILDLLLGQVRQISLDLRPSMLDDLGLVPALRSLLDQQGRRGSVAGRLSAENIPEKLDSEIQTTCFRIAQEAITNALRHAGATRIDVDLRYENAKLWLLIRDNGIGFNVESAQAQTVGLGLIGMQERATLIGGQARIISSPKKGTRIEVSLPLVLRGARGSRD